MANVSFEEAFEQEINKVKMLIRSDNVPEALRLLDELEQQNAARIHSLRPGLRYLIPFSRARAYVQVKQPAQAQAELHMALALAADDVEARARALNLSGVIYYELEQPDKAIACHIECVYLIMDRKIADLNLRLSVFQNLANAYWARDNLKGAISAYREALRVLQDLHAPERQADIYWGLSQVYRAQESWRYARLCCLRAIRIYEREGNRAAEAAMHINFADILLEEGRVDGVEVSLDRAAQLLEGSEDHGSLSFIHRYYAELERRRGNLERASMHATESIRQAEQLVERGQSAGGQVWIDPTRTYAEALHVGSIVAEAQGNTTEADRLFDTALEALKATGLTETRRAIHLSYASVLEARADFEGATKHYKAASQLGL